MTTHPEPLEVQSLSDDSAVVLDLRGELDTYSAPQLRQQLVDIIDGDGCLSVTLRLGGVTFVDSTALGVLIGAHRRMRARGGVLCLEGPRTSVRRVLEITGLTRELQITPP